MRYILIVLSLLLTLNCFAEVDKPRVLIRKSDNKVIGVGYTNFEGVERVDIDYEIKIIEPKDMDIYIKQIKKDEEERVAQEELAKEQKKEVIKAKLKLAVPTLTEEDLEELLND